MAARRLLYFTGEDHYLYAASGGSLELEAKFSGDDLGVTEFRQYLRGRREALFSVLADLAGEDFHEDQIPQLRGSDREAVIRRRLAQRYRDTRLASALSLGTLNTGERRNERLLLAPSPTPSSSPPGSTRWRNPARAWRASTRCRCWRRRSPRGWACAAAAASW
jgi:hypothetical protein